jgi:methyl-accepting chemotaxis protein
MRAPFRNMTVKNKLRLLLILFLLIQGGIAGADIFIARSLGTTTAAMTVVTLATAVASVLALVLTVGGLVVLQRTTVKALIANIRALMQLGAGEASVEAVGADRGDEIGDLARTVAPLRDRIVQGKDDLGQIEAIGRTHAVAEWSPEGKLLKVNQTFLDLFGYAADEIVGQSHAILLPAKADREDRTFFDKLARGEGQTGQYKRLAKGGKEIWIRASYAPVSGADGKVSKVVLVAVDITEEVTSATATTFAAAAFEGTSNPLVLVDRDFRVVSLNQPAAKFFHDNLAAFRTIRPDFNPERMVGLAITALHKDLEEQRQLLNDPSRLPYHSEITIGELDLELTTNGVFDRAHAYIGNVLEWRDVTAARVNRGMIEALDRAEAVVEYNMDGKIITANENFLKIVGYSLDEIVGKTQAIFADPADRATNNYAEFWEKMRRGEYIGGRFKRFGKGDKEVWVQGSYNPILDPNGKVIKVASFIGDVTEATKAALALEAAVGEIQKAVEATKDNDLSKRIPLADKSGEILRLCSGVNGLLDTMGTIVTSIKDASGSLSTAAAEIAMGNTDLSQRTEEQASSLEETAASLEELTAAVKQNSENAQQANKAAVSASEVATKGGAVVAEVVSTMNDITQASRKIADIIGVIDEIAFQTNILALNAAVEAARAGEQGRGFAVVAAEVRNLAQRSANAAKEIKGLISDSVARVEAGSKQVEAAGKATEEIVVTVKQVTGLIEQISIASREQSTGIEEVNTAVSQMDQITQQNAALVEEAAAAAKSMNDQTAGMTKLVSMFTLAGGAPAGTAASPWPATGNKVVDAAMRKASPAKPAASAPAAKPSHAPAPEKRKAVGNGAAADWQEF